MLSRIPDNTAMVMDTAMEDTGTVDTDTDMVDVEASEADSAKGHDLMFCLNN